MTLDVDAAARHPLRLIFGNRRYADLVRHTLETYGSICIDAYVTDKEFLDANREDIAQIDITQISGIQSQAYIGLTFQNKKGPEFLKKVVERLKTLGVSFPGFDFSHEPAITDRGEGAQIFNNTVFDIGSSVGDFSQIRPNVTIGHDVKVGCYTYIAPSASVGSCSTISDQCFVGFGSQIAPNSVIDEGCVIGAGVFVEGHIEKNSLVTRSRPHGVIVKNPFRFL